MTPTSEEAASSSRISVLRDNSDEVTRILFMNPIYLEKCSLAQVEKREGGKPRALRGPCMQFPGVQLMKLTNRVASCASRI
jgi:hypothetical protein